MVTNSSELPTAVLGQKIDIPSTQRLEPRPTSPDRGAFIPPLASASTGTQAGRKLPATIILGAVIVVVIIGIASSVAYVRIRSHSRTMDAAALMYPGSRTIVDMTSDGGRAIHLETGDPLEKVVKWYDASLKPTKTMRLTSTSIVLKNQNVTATIAAEAGKTNILIKQVLTP